MINIKQLKKEKNTKGKRVVMTDMGNGCVSLLYYDNGEIKKAKTFFYPSNSTNAVKANISRDINSEYKLWVECLWHYGYLEEDDIQLMEFKNLTKK